jgi:hypothetical protein
VATPRRAPPAARARSLVTLLFLRAAWQELAGSTGAWPDAWIDDWLSALAVDHPVARANRPTATTIRKILEAGLSRAELTALVRTLQLDVLRRVCELLDGERAELLVEEMPEVEGLAWQLVALDGGKPLGTVRRLGPLVDHVDPARATASSPSERFMQARPTDEDPQHAPRPSRKQRARRRARA